MIVSMDFGEYTSATPLISKERADVDGARCRLVFNISTFQFAMWVIDRRILS
jgi:hypothetical protein